MNRSEFLKKLGIGIGVAMVAPKVLAEETPLVINDDVGKVADYSTKGWWKPALDKLHSDPHYPLTYDECFRFCEYDTFKHKESNEVYVVKKVDEFAGIPMYGITSDHRIITFKTERQLMEDYWHLGHALKKFND